MKKIVYFFIATLALASVAYAAESQIWGEMRIPNILGYGQEQSLKLGEFFTLWQGHYITTIFLGILILIPTVFGIHYLIIGPKTFSHEGKKILAFSLYSRIVHQIAAISFIVIVPTGFIMVFGSFFGGGEFVRICKDLHGVFTIPFAIVVIPMFLMWVKDMFIHLDDIKWLIIVGGYLSKVKNPVPAGRFNAGQKTWYWLATLGGIVMIATGATMFFMDFDIAMVKNITGLSQIDTLRAAAILHNLVGFAVVILFFVHIYMAVFAIKGAVQSIITGYMEEEEVKILHSSWYRKLKKQGKV
ncbi:MAG: formate dehydrogenase subunit gamma [Sulfurospirillaceae bacterium]|jgi:formate dehydrogenase subunit gamma|nr:formate dehydrogenase subunit gamma [Sulfurospirillaceae bacterium]MDD2384291.1 formate dehydrogenase subunit gamma [Sulfurospirillaceae bacterium]MDD2826772.1 formate dehydrogenase subunit gamma [Sulfurospirillaceae bacterium]MDD2826782.1 formate dehydrogenase subunit gamma [Sulfurospirillaceae bacterium]